MSAGRAGSALPITILFLLLLEAVVLGTLHVAMQERRLAGDAEAVLRLRLAAEAAAADAVLVWTAAVDSLRPGDPPQPLLSAMSDDGLATRADVEALTASVFALRASAREEPPRFGRAAMVRLVSPPPLPPGSDPAAAALSARALLPSRGVLSGRSTACTDASADVALRLVDLATLAAAAGAVLTGAVGTLDPADQLAALLPRLEAAATDTVHVVARSGDLDLDADFTGIVLVSGNARIRAGARLRGLLIAAGDLLVEAGGAITGAAHVGGAAAVDGAIVRDPCVVADAAAAARLHLPRPLPHRPVIPAF